MKLAVIQMTEQRLREHMQLAARLGAHQAMRNAGLPIREYYTRTEMQKRYGKSTVDRLIKQGLLTPHRFEDGNEPHRTLYSETEILSLIV